MAARNEILSKWGQLWANLGLSGGYERESEPLQHVARQNTEKHEWQTQTKKMFGTLSTDGSKLGGNGTGWGEGWGVCGGISKMEGTLGGWALPTATSHTSWDWQGSVTVVTMTSLSGLSLTSCTPSSSLWRQATSCSSYVKSYNREEIEVNQQNQSVNTETYNLITQKCGAETQQLLSTCLSICYLPWLIPTRAVQAPPEMQFDHKLLKSFHAVQWMPVSFIM